MMQRLISSESQKSNFATSMLDYDQAILFDMRYKNIDKNGFISNASTAAVDSNAATTSTTSGDALDWTLLTYAAKTTFTSDE